MEFLLCDRVTDGLTCFGGGQFIACRAARGAVLVIVGLDVNRGRLFLLRARGQNNCDGTESSEFKFHVHHSSNTFLILPNYSGLCIGYVVVHDLATESARQFGDEAKLCRNINLVG